MSRDRLDQRRVSSLETLDAIMNRRRQGAALSLGLRSAAQIDKREVLTSCHERDPQLDTDTGSAADQHSRRRALRHFGVNGHGRSEPRLRTVWKTLR